MMNNSFGTYLSTVRTTGGYSQKTLAAELGIATSSVNRWETGVTCPDKVQLVKLLTLFPDRKEKLVDLWLKS